MSRQQAIDAVNKFAKGDKPPAFVKMSRYYVANELLMRIYDPYSIDQYSAGLCGPAAVAHEILKQRPFEYVNAVISLFDWGLAYIRKWKLQPCSDLKQAPCPVGMPPADWILLASIRDSENWFFDYTKELDQGGTGTSEMEGMLSRAGYTDVQSDVTKTNDDDEQYKAALLRRSLSLYEANYQMIWVVRGSMVRGDVDHPKPDRHYVVLAGDFIPPVIKDDHVRIPIFTWGEHTQIPTKGKITYRQFLDGYFGYIAAKF